MRMTEYDIEEDRSVILDMLLIFGYGVIIKTLSFKLYLMIDSL